MLFLFLFPVTFSHDFDLITAIAFVRLGGMLHTCGFSHAVRRVSEIRISRERGSKEVSRW